MEDARTVIFFGIQGSGKGTQARLLEKYFDENTNRSTLYLETGKLLRQFATRDGYTNTLVKQTIDAGGLLPSFVPMYVIADALVSHFTGVEHLILDGVARRENQTAMIDTMLGMYSRHPYDVIILEVPEHIAVERIMGRGRADDTPEAIRTRISWTREHEQNILDKFKTFNCRLHIIDATGTIADIHESIRTALHLS